MNRLTSDEVKALVEMMAHGTPSDEAVKAVRGGVEMARRLARGGVVKVTLRGRAA
jgi:hypothetical protein